MRDVDEGDKRYRIAQEMYECVKSVQQYVEMLLQLRQDYGIKRSAVDDAFFFCLLVCCVFLFHTKCPLYRQVPLLVEGNT